MRQWQSTPVLMSGKSHGWRSLVGYSPWCREESDTTEWHHSHFSLSCTGEGNGNPLQYSCLENPRDGSLVGCCLWGRSESDMTEWLHFHFSLSCTGEGNGNPLPCSCLENPRGGEPGGLPSMGSHRVEHDWSDLAAAAAAWYGLHWICRLLWVVYSFSFIDSSDPWTWSISHPWYISPSICFILNFFH